MKIILFLLFLLIFSWICWFFAVFRISEDNLEKDTRFSDSLFTKKDKFSVFFAYYDFSQKNVKRSLRLVEIIRKLRKDYLFSNLTWNYRIISCENQIIRSAWTRFYQLLGLSRLISTNLEEFSLIFFRNPKKIGLGWTVFTNLH